MALCNSRSILLARQQIICCIVPHSVSFVGHTSISFYIVPHSVSFLWQGANYFRSVPRSGSSLGQNANACRSVPHLVASALLRSSARALEHP